VLSGGAGRRIFAACPFCERPVRKLYAPAGEEHFLCRRCHDLVYRRIPQQESLAALAEVQAAMGSLLEGLYSASPAGEGPAAVQRSNKALLGTLKDELPLEPQELRVYCLRLAKAALSVRQIAALVGTSKSSVGRYLAAGRDGLDREVLIAERLRRYWAVAELSPEAGLRALRQQMKVFERRARQYRRYSASGGEPEERLFIARDAADEVDAAAEESI
jgi:transposase-like protein